MRRSRDPIDSMMQAGFTAVFAVAGAVVILAIPLLVYGLVATVRFVRGVLVAIANSLGLADRGLDAEGPVAILCISVGLVFAVLLPIYFFLHLHELLTWILVGLVVGVALSLVCLLAGEAPADDFLEKLRFWS